MRDLEKELEELEALSLRRELRHIDSAQGVRIERNGQLLYNFGSNDYLGLSQHPEVKAAFQQGIEQWGAGAGASRLVSGSLPPHRALEQWLAEAKGTEAALSFANGYSTAVGAVSGLMRKGDVVILDKLCHASLIDGARMSGATLRVFGHNNMEQLKQILQQVQRKGVADKRVLIVTESVFSMDGDHARLEEMIRLKHEYEALLMVDEAHGLGVLGANGLGLSEALGVSSEIDIHMGTLGKAAGVAGGYLCASQSVIDVLVNRARSLIYSTAPPPAQAVAALAALQLIASPVGAELRATLWKNLHQFQLETGGEQKVSSAIIPWHVGCSERVLQLSQKLIEGGCFCPAIRYPTVPRTTERLRITLTAAHSPEAVTHLANLLQAV